MVEKEFGKIEYNQVKMEILKRVNAEGLMGDIESWKIAFPDIDFYDLVIPSAEAQELYDAGSTEGMVEVNWNERTVSERIFYVAYLNDPCKAEIRYDMVIEDELMVGKTIKDPEVIWYMWVAGCFSGEDLTEEALREYVGEGTEDLDLEKVQILNLEAKVARI